MEKKLNYYAHISEDGTRKQTVLEHLKGTAELAGNFAGEFGYSDWGACLGMLHDIGKYTRKFQERLLGSALRVDHATAGAQLCHELFCRTADRQKGGFYFMLGYCIAGHHSGLPDFGGSLDTGSSPSYLGRMKKKVEDYKDYKEEVIPPELKTLFPWEGTVEITGFQMSFFIRMLYSCLVDADYLDTENFMKNGDVKREAGVSLQDLWEKAETYVSAWRENKDLNTINGRRTEILNRCIEMGNQEKGLFRMTVPTGGGKTVASLAFALRHGVVHGMKRIIYVIPYTSIIEQNARIFREILGAENVLEHHWGVNYEDSEELHPMQLAAENWDKPVVVTTNVQFFESLFSNRSSKCRKLHNLANSVIIFDEAQMLPNDYLLPCIGAVEELADHYGSSVVLCTATQPALDKFLRKKGKPRELCPRVKEQFAFFQRSYIRKLGKITAEELIERLQKETQALCILNTKREVQWIWQQFEQSLKPQQKEGIYQLSTLMYPAHRKRVLTEIRCRLQEGKRCILIATSLVEAGVDLDFQTVYRQLAGVDSVIQAAGRCNREGRRSIAESGTFVFQLEGGGKVPGQEQQIDAAKLVQQKYEDLSSLEAMEAYFQELYNLRGEALDKKQIMQQWEKEGLIFAKIARQFRLIEQDTRTIFIPKEEEAKQILEILQQRGTTRGLLRKAGQYCVNVYQNLFDKMNQAGMLLPVWEDLKEELFVLRDCKDYSEKQGLQVRMELGEGIWF